MIEIDDDDPPPPAPLRIAGMRFEPVITFGNVLSLTMMIIVGVGGGVGIYNSLLSQISDLREKNTMQDGVINELRVRTEGNTAAINQGRDDAKDLRNEMRGGFSDLGKQLGLLREDLARYGAIKGH